MRLNLPVYFIAATLVLPGFAYVKTLPKICVILLARNKEIVLPHFLRLFEDLDYPKEKLSLYIRSDHNSDKTPYIIKTWVNTVISSYKHVDLFIDDSPGEQEYPLTGWTDERYDWIIKLREKALEYARSSWADFVWFLDCDVFLTNPLVLKDLMESQSDSALFAPMLESAGLYSNFWAGMTSEYYYMRTKEYEPILNRKNPGAHSVPMIHSCFFINLNIQETNFLSFDPDKIKEYDGPNDDMIAFARSAFIHDIPMKIINSKQYGYITIPLLEGADLSGDKASIVNVRLSLLTEKNPRTLPYVKELKEFVYEPKIVKPNVDRIYIINLKRREERKKRMALSLQELGLEVEWIEAVDGKNINEKYLKDHGITMMPDFQEPYHKRPLKYGEIGCFMSHYKIWEDVIKNKYSKVIIFEDDIRFESFFNEKLDKVLEELEDLEGYWDLVYLGRKILKNSQESWLEGSKQLVKVDYTYWTLSYVIHYEGVKKIMNSNPLSKMVPVDEYLPIMFDRHPNDTWKQHFKNRNLRAFSVHPLLVNPILYTGEDGYISDTEDSIEIVRDEL